MAQFRTTADILDLSLQKAGEVTSGTSPYETQALNYLNRVHLTLIAGGTIPVGKDTTIQIDELWPWAKAKSPMTITLQSKYSTGTVSLTNGSVSGTFSSAPSDSKTGWYLRLPGRDGLYRIGQHTASSTSFSLDNEYLGSTGTTLNFEVAKLDYELVPEYIVTNTENDKIQFQETAGTTITGTLTHGVRSPSDYISHVVSVLNSAGGTPVYTGSYDSVTRKFTISSDRGGSSVFVLVGTGDVSYRSAHKTLGFDDENTTNAASVTSTYALGGICRLVEPFRLVTTSQGAHIFGIDSESFSRDYPLSSIQENTPTRFAVIREDSDGRMIVRFNAYPKDEQKIEIEHVPVPRDLKDSSASIPLIPRKHIDILEDATVFYLMLDKSDDKAQTYAQLLQGKLNAMIAQHRGSLARTGENFGRIVPRLEQTSIGRRSLFGWEPYS